MRRNERRKWKFLGGPSRISEMRWERERERENKLNIYLKIKAILLQNI